MEPSLPESPFIKYVLPLISRYTDRLMQELFGERRKFTIWRQFWMVMAKCQSILGAPVATEQVAELKAHVEITDDEIRRAMEIEKKKRHDVTSHSITYGETCPSAAAIIHLACTSMYVCDNTDIILMAAALDMIEVKIIRVLARMAAQARKWKDQPTLGFTHLKPAQLTTVGKRIAMWMQDLVMDLEALRDFRSKLRLLGAKGATGTQDSYLKLFEGDASKVRALDRMVSESFGFPHDPALVCGQTYTRKVDAQLLGVLAGIAGSVHKIMQDLRLLQHMMEIEEPFEKDQVGSSAMVYKRNPMRAERACGLSRHVIASATEAYMTHALQMFERTLDDSAPRRMYLPISFLTIDAVLTIMQNVFEGLVVYPKMIERHLREEMPFMATEEMLDVLVKAGKNRGECHERLRVIAQEAGRKVKEEGISNPFLDLVAMDPFFADVVDHMADALDAKNYIGLAPQQTERFLDEKVEPILAAFRDVLDSKSELRV